MILLIAFPAVTLTARGGTGICFFALLACALISLPRAGRRDGKRLVELLGAGRWYIAAMVALPIAIAIQQAASGQWRWQPYDTPLRLALSIPILLFLATVPVRRLIAVHWGFTLGALGTALVAYRWTDIEGLGRATNAFLNPVPFGYMAALLGLLSGLSIGWVEVDRKFTRLLKLLGCGAGLWASYLSETRGAWIMAALLLLGALLAARRLGPRKRLCLVVLLLALCALCLIYIGPVNERLLAAVSDFRILARGDLDTSLGNRFQLWHASLLMFWHHPLTGVGAGNFVAALTALAREGQASSTLLVFRHAHNEILYAMAELGLPGLAAIVLIYLGPVVIYLRHANAVQPCQQIAARLGLIVCAAFLIAGLTESMFVLTMTDAFYALLNATLLGIVLARPAVNRAGQ
jgi:O-antigen ligase